MRSVEKELFDEGSWGDLYTRRLEKKGWSRKVKKRGVIVGYPERYSGMSKEGEEYFKTHMPIRVDGKEYWIPLTEESMRNLDDAFGDRIDDCVGRTVTISIAGEGIYQHFVLEAYEDTPLPTKE